ncbi:MAG TPA: hypothetical protein VKQ73_15210 [Stellaceae bacterium]|nr:hypothetical protein [Stellaceae bacterium]
MTKLFAGLAALALALVMLSPPAAAHCWRGQRGQCWHHRYVHHAAWRHRWYRAPPQLSGPAFYPYAYYPAPAGYSPYSVGCLPIGYFCFR